MRAFIVGLIIGFIIVPLGVYMYFSTGSAPVATSAQAMPFEKMLANLALHARLDKEMPKSVPIPADETNFATGAKVYRQNCSVCHGLPGQPESSIAKGMFPFPPQLFKGKGVTDDPAQETYWKVSGGIRMTGMPSFRDTLTDREIWQVSVLLANADKISQSVKNSLAETAPSAQATTSGKLNGTARSTQQ